MEHKIKIRIDNKVYNGTIHSEEEEANIRKAVADVNETVAKIAKDYANKVTSLDIMTIAALNIGIERVEFKNRLEELQRKCDKLSADLQSYVDSLK